MKLKNLFICKYKLLSNLSKVSNQISLLTQQDPFLFFQISLIKRELRSRKCIYDLDLVDHVDSYPEDLSGKKVVVIGGNVGLDVVEFFVLES